MTTTSTRTTATYTKLRDGSWGLRIPGSAAAGQQWTARKRDGSEKVETVGRIVWAGPDVTLATIASSSRRSTSRERECPGSAHSPHTCPAWADHCYYYDEQV